MNSLVSNIHLTVYGLSTAAKLLGISNGYEYLEYSSVLTDILGLATALCWKNHLFAKRLSVSFEIYEVLMGSALFTHLIRANGDGFPKIHLAKYAIALFRI